MAGGVGACFGQGCAGAGDGAGSACGCPAVGAGHGEGVGGVGVAGWGDRFSDVVAGEWAVPGFPFGECDRVVAGGVGLAFGLVAVFGADDVAEVGGLDDAFAWPLVEDGHCGHEVVGGPGGVGGEVVGPGLDGEFCGAGVLSEA